MIDSLEALERIRKAPTSYWEEEPRFTHTYFQDLGIIEKALKERDEFELKYAKTHVALCKSREENSNEKQALRVIKKKKVDVRAFIEIFEKGWTWEQYAEEENDENTGGHQFSNDRLTQEEFNLLKEVML